MIAALLEAEGELPADVEAELIELRRASFASAGHARGHARVRREAPAALAKHVGRNRTRALTSGARRTVACHATR